jgi:hypothetical protein
MAFRWFNYIPSGEAIKHILLEEGWNSDRVYSVLKHRDRFVTGAYIIKTVNGMTKLQGICQQMDWAMERIPALLLEHQIRKPMTLAWFHRRLCEFSHLGKFMAYELVTDLRFTYLLRDATDIDTWASAGPGCARGLGWLVANNQNLYSYTSMNSQQTMLELMRQLLEHSRNPLYWSPDWPRWEMREVEHSLCEYDKWRRGHAGERLKRKYP